MIYLGTKNETNYGCDYIHFDDTPPEPKIEIAEVPLRDGYVDLTAMLSPMRRYSSRTLHIGLELRGLRSTWMSNYQALLADVHGQELKISRTEDANWFYIGYCTVGALEDHGASAGITIEVMAQPFKRSATVRATQSATLNGGTSTKTFSVTDMRGYLEFTTTSTNMTVTYSGRTWTLASGTNTDCNGLILPSGSNSITLKGNGSVTVNLRGGTL